MIATRRLQRSFADGLIHEAVDDLWEPWMRHADQALEDEALLFGARKKFPTPAFQNGPDTLN